MINCRYSPGQNISTRPAKFDSIFLYRPADRNYEDGSNLQEGLHLSGRKTFCFVIHLCVHGATDESHPQTRPNKVRSEAFPPSHTGIRKVYLALMD